MQRFKRRRNGIVEAIRHDGTDESARHIVEWLASCGCVVKVAWKGQFDYDLDNAYLRIENSRAQNLVTPWMWVVKVEDGMFYPISNEDFNILYEEVSEDKQW